MRRVFLVCEPSVKKAKTAGGSLPNLTALFAHGPVITLLTSQDPRPVSDPAGTLLRLEERLDAHAFDPATDCLAWGGGDPIAAMLLGAVLERSQYDVVQWLRYDRVIAPDGSRTDEGAVYTPISVPLFTS